MEQVGDADIYEEITPRQSDWKRIRKKQVRSHEDGVGRCDGAPAAQSLPRTESGPEVPWEDLPKPSAPPLPPRAAWQTPA